MTCEVGLGGFWLGCVLWRVVGLGGFGFVLSRSG